ncbi:sugar transporter, putative [Talaromyces stipitatus ATCC 10500]|uniref:Sugar transporter, putative n=1 Tax=Talaromyces stipitatus (strain ATCC 10500 / CBS 375.48 / QM 6759 / NRRL 1006) TaxID=441959 RepID=B8MEH9_TALSN|nr:sugar transporter, putative [Talaromyces stipitatus ATCC 10500]EED16606.1 sugar transporter, putative [Talaromyces stipitatus ATCC 10500]
MNDFSNETIQRERSISVFREPSIHLDVAKAMEARLSNKNEGYSATTLAVAVNLHGRRQKEKPTIELIEQTEERRLVYLANEEDHALNKWASVKKYPWSFFWCNFAIWCILLVSFENQVSGNVTGIPDGGPVASAVVGALSFGQIADTIGRRWIILCALVISVVAVTLEFVATTNEIFFSCKFLNGFALGALSSVPVTNVGEIAPLALRRTYYNRWAYRAVFVAQYGYVAMAFAGIFFMPESPWWLVSKDREEKALSSLSRFGHSDVEKSKKLAFIKVTLKQVRLETEGATYLECFRCSNLRRTIISIAPLTIQALSRVVFAAGKSSLPLVISCHGNPNHTGAIRGTAAMILIYSWWYNLTIGAAGNTILTESSTSRLRVKTIAIGLALQNAIYTM